MFLYYIQMGRCMYSGEPSSLTICSTIASMILTIFTHNPRTKDDSIDNRVLVKKQLNELKSDAYTAFQQLYERMPQSICGGDSLLWT